MTIPTISNFFAPNRALRIPAIGAPIAVARKKTLFRMTLSRGVQPHASCNGIFQNPPKPKTMPHVPP